MDKQLKNRVWISYFGLFITVALMSTTKYLNLNTTFFDLGIFLNNFSKIASGEWQNIFLSHIQPYSLFWSAFYSIFPNDLAPILILITQSALLASPILGLYYFYGPVVALAYGLYFPVWYNALFDFHLDHMAVPILFAFFFLEKMGKIQCAVAMGVALALVKEVFALQSIFCGLYLALTRKNRPVGIGLAIFGITYFLFATQFIQQYFNFSFVQMAGGWDITSTKGGPFAWLGKSMGEIFLNLITQPHLAIWEIISNFEKLKYIFYIFVPLCFIPFLSPRILLVAAPIMGISLLSSHPSYYAYVHHYSAGLIAPTIIAFSESLPTAKNIWKHIQLPQNYFIPALISGLFLFHILLSPSPIGRKFYQKKSWFHHYTVYVPNERNSMIKSALKTHVPPDPSLLLSVQNTLNWNPLIKNRAIFIFPHGATHSRNVYEASEINWSNLKKFLMSGEMTQQKILEKKWADYVVLDLKRPWYIVDRGCPWIAGKCHNAEDFESEFLNLIKETKKNFKTIFEHDGFLILKRNLMKNKKNI